MAQATTLTLVGTAPASTTWLLMSRSANEAVWQDQRRGVVNQFGTIKMNVAQIRDSQQKLTGKYRVGFKYVEPTIRAINGSDVILDPNLVDVTVRLSGDATSAEKAHLMKVGQSMLAHAIFGASVQTGESLT